MHKDWIGDELKILLLLSKKPDITANKISEKPDLALERLAEL